MRLLHLLPFRNNHCHILIIVESATLNCDFSVFQIQYLQSCCVHLCPWSAGGTSSIIIMDVSTISNSAPFSDIPHPHYTITIHLYQFPLNFIEGHNFAHKNQITDWTSLRGQISSVIDIAHQLIPWIASECLLQYLLHITPTKSVTSPTKK